MALQTITLLTTQQNIENYLSQLGVKNRLDDDGDGRISAYEQQALADAIIEASETIYFYCWDWYSAAALATSNLVNRWATIFAAYRVCTHQGNPAPAQVVEDAAHAEERLQKVKTSWGKLPGVPLKRILAPVMSLTRVDPRFNFRCIRVERNNSSQHNPTTLRQNTDWQEAYTFEI